MDALRAVERFNRQASIAKAVFDREPRRGVSIGVALRIEGDLAPRNLMHHPVGAILV